jgi:orotidine-5'-phosphate decarboxylase
MKKTIVGLDVSSGEEAISIVAELGDNCFAYKIGKQLFTTCGPRIVNAVRSNGGEVFLDLKYHDIPNTVAAAMLEAGRLGVKFANLHALGGAEMMETTVAAVHKEFSATERPKLLAVTILTSSTMETLKRVGIDRPVDEMVLILAKLAKECGMDGVVASPLEIAIIREACGPDFLIVTPGVRPTWAAADDQKRIMTPAEAVSAGSDYLVISRPVLKHPVEVGSRLDALQLINEEVLAAK